MLTDSNVLKVPDVEHPEKSSKMKALEEKKMELIGNSIKSKPANLPTFKLDTKITYI